MSAPISTRLQAVDANIDHNLSDSSPRILGIDPGLGRIGFGLMAAFSDASGQADSWGEIEWGVISTDKTKPDGERLQELYNDLHELITRIQPTVMSLEKLFFFKNISTALPVSQARGVILLVAAQHGVPVFEYTPMQVKLCLTGYGKASKSEVQTMITSVLALEKKPTPDDAADALAMAYCYYLSHGRFANPGGIC